MKAWTLQEIGRLEMEEKELPPLRPGEVRVRVMASGICGSDVARVYETGAHNMPLTPGHEFSGVVEKVGSGVDETWRGKRVGIYPLLPCGKCPSCKNKMPQLCENYGYLGSRQDGGFAEYVAVPEKNLVALPEGITFEMGAMLEPASVALHAIRQADPDRSKPVLVIGLGTIGLLATMLLRDLGVETVFVRGKRAEQLEKAKSLGAKEWDGNEPPGVVLECVGREETILQAVQSAAPAGKVVLVGNPASDIRLPKELYWKILRKELTLYGTWNSTFLPGQTDDWDETISRMQRIHPEQLISHRLPLEGLTKGLSVMRGKKEPYTKIMIYPGGVPC